MKSMLRAIVALLIAASAAVAGAQEFPSRPLRIIVPFPPGGAADSLARIIAEPLGARLGQPVVVDNRPGAAGNIGTQAVAQAPADGHTMLLGFDGTLVINPHVYSSLPFDTLRDFAPVTKLGDIALILVTHPSLGARNLGQFLALAKAANPPLPYGTTGTGSTLHLVAELLKQRTGIPLDHIPFKGGSQAVASTLAGEVPVASAAIATVVQHVKAGKLAAIGVTTAARSQALPEVPTLAESGLAGFDVASWNGILVPARTPRPVIDRLQREIAEILRAPQVRERLLALGIEPVGNTSAQFAGQIRQDLARWGEVVKAARIRIE